MPARRLKKTASKKKQKENSTIQDDSDNMELFGRITRSGTTLQRIQSLLKNIENQNATQILQNDSMECIVGCGRNKSMLLLPCHHQHTCKECWLIWKIESIKNIPQDIFDQSFDDDLMKPKCLVCRSYVDEEIIALN